MTSTVRSDATAMDDKFFFRSSRWDWHDGATVDLLDDAAVVVATLDAWQTLVFHEANGDRRVGELVSWLATQYRNPADLPADLADTVQAALRFLVDAHAIELGDRSRDLPYHLELPVAEQDPETARTSMDEARAS